MVLHANEVLHVFFARLLLKSLQPRDFCTVTVAVCTRYAVHFPRKANFGQCRHPNATLLQISVWEPTTVKASTYPLKRLKILGSFWFWPFTIARFVAELNTVTHSLGSTVQAIALTCEQKWKQLSAPDHRTCFVACFPSSLKLWMHDHHYMYSSPAKEQWTSQVVKSSTMRDHMYKTQSGGLLRKRHSKWWSIPE